MAIWQFKIELLPTDEVRFRVGEPPCSLPATFQGSVGYHSTNGGSFWTSRATSVAVPYFRKLLRETQSWTSDALMYGEEDGDKVEVWDDSVVAMIDCRNLDESFVFGVLSIANALECSLLVVETGWVIPAEKEFLVREIESSRALRFVSRPEAALRSLKLRK